MPSRLLSFFEFNVLLATGCPAIKAAELADCVRFVKTRGIGGGNPKGNMRLGMVEGGWRMADVGVMGDESF